MAYSPEQPDRPGPPATQHSGPQPPGHVAVGDAGSGERESSPYAPGSAQFSGAGPSPQAGRNVPGVIALTAAILLLLVAIVRQFIAAALPLLMAETGMSIGEMTNFYLTPVMILTLILGLIATIAGGIGMARRSAPRTAAAIGLAIGVWVLTLEVVAWVAPRLI